MKKPKFSLLPHRNDEKLVELVDSTDQIVLAHWAIECVERVLPYFEQEFPEDTRPRTAINTLWTWIKTPEFSMKVIRKASLNAHAAAREVGEDNPARSAARAAGQAVATAHVPTHAIGAAIYALQAIHRATDANEIEVAITNEKEWQYRRLCELRENSTVMQ